VVVVASECTAAVALDAGSASTVPAAMISNAHALVVARAIAPTCLVLMAFPSFQPVIINPRSGSRRFTRDRSRSL
jgi:hypothetical protein